MHVIIVGKFGDIMKSLFNEDRYLNDDKESLEFFLRERNIYLKKVQNSRDKYGKAINYYDTFLDVVCAELLKLDLDNSLEYSIALNYLIDKGYLSDNNLFESRVSDFEVLSKLGMSIIWGSGCCRNTSDMHKDVFDKLELKTIPFYCYLGNDFLGRGKNNCANHVINLVEYNDNLYGVDLYNNCIIYHFKNPFIIKSISSYYNDTLRYKPYYEIIADGRELDDIRSRINEFSDYSTRGAISSLEYESDIKYNVKKKLQANESELANCFEKTKVLKKQIIQEVGR